MKLDIRDLKAEFKISVRELVEFLLRHGDLDDAVSAQGQAAAMQEGTRVHKALQKKGGPYYQSEQPLSHRVEMDGYNVLLEGRADGIMEQDGNVTIDEIKTTSGKVEEMEAPEEVHLAQAKCYAYIYALDNGLEKIRVRMTYVHVDPFTEKEKKPQAFVPRYFRYGFSFPELSEWFEELISSLSKWTGYLFSWTKARDGSIRQLSFPYPYRKGQKRLAEDVYRTILRKKILFLQAPTGVGKTLAVLFPSIKAMGEGLCSRIFYLAAKNVTAKAAQEAFSLLHGGGLKMKYVLLTAKEKICPMEKTACNPASCPRAKGHFDRVNDALYFMLTGQGAESYGRQQVLEAAEQFDVCPFELSLDLTDWTDAAICDYNYVFDPQAKLKRFFSEGKKGSYLYLVDEAHNLVDRAREMYSAQLCKEDFLAVKKILKPLTKKAGRSLDRCNQWMLEKKKESDGLACQKDIDQMVFDVMQLSSQLDEVLRTFPSFEGREEVLQLYFSLREFLQASSLLDENYTVFTRTLPDGRFILKLFCANPSRNLQECYDSGVSTILFSATLIPVNYYKRQLCLEEDPYAVYAQTPFTKGQKTLLVASDVSSRYKERGPETYGKAAAYLELMVEGREGNYIAFFPSYKVLREVYGSFCRRCHIPEDGLAKDGLSKHGLSKDASSKYGFSKGGLSDDGLPGDRAGRTSHGMLVRTALQEEDMGQSQREGFLEKFSDPPREGSFLAFCVLGGVFSEGINLDGDKLVGTAIFGTGLPQVSEERDLLKDYYDQNGGDGFRYAYLYPGLNKVFQAAGRVIRTSKDRGVILLLDRRFLQRECRDCFPREWEGYQACTLDTAAGLIRNFWAGGKGQDGTSS